MADIIELISKAKPGLAAYASFSRVQGGAMETGFFVQEEKRYINKIPKYGSTIQTKCSLINYGGVGFIVVYVLFERDFNMLYEICFNYHADRARENFQQLATQKKLTFHFFTGAERMRQIETTNRMQDFFRGALAELVLYPAWKMADFDRAKEIFYSQYPRPEIFFRTAQQMDRFS